MAAPARAAKERAGFEILFPPRSGPKGRQARDDKTPKEAQIAFRAPADLLEYIHGITALGYSKTEAVIRLLYVARDVVEGLGPNWWEIEAKAHKEGSTPGKALAAMALAGLKKR